MKIYIDFDKFSKQFIKRFPGKIVKIVLRAFRLGVIDAERQAKKSFNRGQAPRVRTGYLRRSIYSKVKGFAAYIASPLPYAAILQWGGRTRPHVIRAKNARALRFIQNGQWVYFKKVNHPGSKILPHPYVLLSVKHRATRRFMKIMSNYITKESEKEMGKL